MSYRPVRVLGLMAFLMMGEAAAADPIQEDLIIRERKITCSADWTCAGDTDPRGNLSSSREFEEEEDELCRTDLLVQLSGTGLCPLDRYDVVEGTFEVVLTERERLMLTCASGQGQALCRDLDALLESLRWTCTGSACYDVWRNQANAMRPLISWPEHVRRLDAVLAPRLAEDVERAARTMCSVRRTGDPQWIRYITDMNNAAGSAMAELQELGGLYPAYLCRQVIR